eukprot:3552750-Heterocapsa_arctica.AAC.1
MGFSQLEVTPCYGTLTAGLRNIVLGYTPTDRQTWLSKSDYFELSLKGSSVDSGFLTWNDIKGYSLLTATFGLESFGLVRGGCTERRSPRE